MVSIFSLQANLVKADWMMKAARPSGEQCTDEAAFTANFVAGRAKIIESEGKR